MSMSSKSYRKGVAEVVYRRRDEKIEYLLLHSMRFRNWRLLKGSHRNMPERDVVDKELFDEAGLKAIDVRIVPQTRVKYEFPKHEDKGYKCIGQDFQVYAVEIDPKAEVHLDFKENDDCFWATVEEAERILAFENLKRVVRKVDKFIKEKL